MSKDSKSSGASWHGASDARPSSSTSAKAQQKPHTPNVGDWRGQDDSRPKSGTSASQTVKK